MSSLFSRFRLSALAVLFLGFAFASCASRGPAVDSASTAAVSAPSPAARPASGEAADPRLFEWTGDPDYRSPRHAEIRASSLANQAKNLSPKWQEDSVFYHIWVKSFNDYDGDGVGDFRGITAKLDYIKNDVGADAIWLSPIFDCAGKGGAPGYNMHGYDTVDYYEVNEYFGNMDHLEELLREAHSRGMKVIFDYVPNHTSSAHPWFLLSSRRDPEKQDWYLWSREKLNWAPMGNSATWHRNMDRGEWYYGAFWSGMPDLNYRNREVREEMKNVVRFWLNKGFDGVRIDAVRYLAEEADESGRVSLAGLVDTEPTHDFFEELQEEVVSRYAELGHPKFMIGEAWINNNPSRLQRYFGANGDAEFDALFDFDFSNAVAMGVRFRNTGIFRYGADIPDEAAARASYGVFLSNHDNLSSRPGTIFKTDRELRLASSLGLLFPGIPFLYYGNEIGQKDEPGLGGQDVRLRFPFDWSAAQAQIGDSASLLALHRRLIALRNAHPALRKGQRILLPGVTSAETGETLPQTGAWALVRGSDILICAVNLSLAEIPAVRIDLEPLFSQTGLSPAAIKAMSPEFPETAAALSPRGTIAEFKNLGAQDFQLYSMQTE